MTEKDAVKLSVIIDRLKPEIDIYALELGIDLDLDIFFKDTEILNENFSNKI